MSNTKNILIINAHPDPESFCRTLAEHYRKGAVEAGAVCRLIHLSELQFDPILHHGYNQRTELEPDLLMCQQEILAADHLVFVYPTWWGTYPALLKGFIDRIFLPKFAFQYRTDSLFWKKLLKGKSARLIVTMDTPKWYYALVYRSPGHQSLKKNVLEFCGVRPVRITTFSPLKRSTEKKRLRWVEEVKRLGSNLR